MGRGGGGKGREGGGKGSETTAPREKELGKEGKAKKGKEGCCNAPREIKFKVESYLDLKERKEEKGRVEGWVGKGKKKGEVRRPAKSGY